MKMPERPKVLNRAYVYANGKLMAEQTPDGQFYWTHNDHLGSTRKLTSTSGAVVYRGEFDPYGKAVLETGSVSLNSHKFTGYERDWATGLDYANARMYTSQYGRFMQSDPVTQGCGNRNPDILAGAKQHKPQSLNRYGYVQNDPVNFIDPTGLLMILPGDCAEVYVDGIYFGNTCGGGGGVGGGGFGWGGWSSGGGFGGGPVRACGRSCQICKGGCHALFVLCVFTCGSTGPFVVPCFLSCVVGYDICLGGCKNW
jgi:RHS repeat-associated protein